MKEGFLSELQIQKIYCPETGATIRIPSRDPIIANQLPNAIVVELNEFCQARSGGPIPDRNASAHNRSTIALASNAHRIYAARFLREIPVSSVTAFQEVNLRGDDQMSGPVDLVLVGPVGPLLIEIKPSGKTHSPTATTQVRRRKNAWDTIFFKAKAYTEIATYERKGRKLTIHVGGKKSK